MNKLVVPVCHSRRATQDLLFSPDTHQLGTAKPLLVFNTIQEKAMCPGSPNQAGQLGQTDPDPHTGVGHKGTIVSHPGTSVSSILLKRHIPDALAKVSEDVRDLWDTRGTERGWLTPLPPS